MTYIFLVYRYQAGTGIVLIIDGLLFMPVFESSRKVQVSGSSLALTLPAMFVKASEIEKGSVMNVLYGLDGVLIISLGEDQQTLEGLMKILEKLEKKIKDHGGNLVDEDL